MLHLMKHVVGGIIFILCGLITSVSLYAADGYSLERVLQNIRSSYEESIKSIEDMVIETESHTRYYKKAFDNGNPYFKQHVVLKDNDMTAVSTISDNELLNPEMFEAVRKAGVYKGIEEINGSTAHVLFIEDFHEILPYDVDVEINQATIYIDTEKWIVSRMLFDVDTEVQGVVRRVHPVVQMEDLRNVEGMIIPFRIVTVVEGISGELTEEEREQAERAMEEFENRLAAMSEQEREMMKQMAGGQIEEYRKMIEEDRFKSTIEIKDIQVNVGLADDLFEQ